MGIFSGVQGYLTYTVGGPIRPRIELIRALVHVIVTCKYGKEWMKNSRGDAVFPIITLSVTMETSGRIWPNVELIQALMYVIITCKHEKDPIKNSGEKWETSGIFSDVQGQLTPQLVETPFFTIITLSVTVETSG